MSKLRFVDCGPCRGKGKRGGGRCRECGGAGRKALLNCPRCHASQLQTLHQNVRNGRLLEWEAWQEASCGCGCKWDAYEGRVIEEPPPRERVQAGTERLQDALLHLGEASRALEAMKKDTTIHLALYEIERAAEWLRRSRDGNYAWLDRPASEWDEQRG